MTKVSKVPTLIFSWGGAVSNRPCRNNDIAEALCDYFNVYYLSPKAIVKRKYRFKVLNTRLYAFLCRRRLHRFAANLLLIIVRTITALTNEPIYVLNMGDDALYLRHLRCMKYHFDLIDPCLSSQKTDQEMYQRFITNQVAVSTSTSATAIELWRKLYDHGAKPVLIPNATSYIESSDQVEERPSFWAETYKNVISYVGGLNIRVDFELIELIATSVPDSLIILTSKPTDEVSYQVNRLSKLNNVTVTGYLSDSEILFILRRTNIGLIPFVADHIGNAINPQKLYDYCAFGFPIISTRTIEMERFSEYVHFVDKTNISELASIVGALLQGEDVQIVERKLQLAIESTWKVRAIQIRDAMLTDVN
jgi:hypothetical protein